METNSSEVNFEDLAFVDLTPDILQEGFDCKEDLYNDFLYSRGDFLGRGAVEQMIERLSVTFLVFHEGILVGYATWFLGCQDKDGKYYKRLSNHSPDLVPASWPAITIMQIAMIASIRGRGYGRLIMKKLLDTAIDLPVRCLVAEAYPELDGFYGRMGFQRFMATKARGREASVYCFDVVKFLSA